MSMILREFLAVTPMTHECRLPVHLEIVLSDQESAIEMCNSTEVAIGLIDKHVLQGALQTVPEKFKSYEATESDVREIVADAYLTLGLYKQASPEFEPAPELRQVVFGPDDPPVN